jgi:membrane fusion protein (multidrug efflux system)
LQRRARADADELNGRNPGFRRKENEMAMWHCFLKGRSRHKVATALGMLALAVALSACDRGQKVDEAKKTAAAPPPPAVVVAEVVQKTVPIYSEYVAQTDARETVEIRARVQAFLDAQHFTEGTVVKKDQLLFTLDKREYEAKLLQAKAELEVAMARLGKAETDERRLKPLAERKAVPQQDYDNAAANLLAAQAAVSAAKSKVVEAELNLSYCTIKSPIAGLIGKRLVSPGNLVGKGEATLLDTVSSIDPIRVNATISEAEYLRFFANRKERGAAQPLELLLADGSDFPHKGKLVIVDRAVDQKTGTLNIAAEFPNPDGQLRPGQFGRVRAVVEMAKDAILVPKRAVQEIQGMKTVLVVGADDMVALRTIQSGETVGDLLIVRDGVKPGERVIVEGVQKARPGSKVNPTVASADSPPAAKKGEKDEARPADAKPAKKAAGK